uniref:Putative extracellular matrix protein papilin 2 n=1 Tax=Ixodes ricinus TaxID=34613 RepID=A0A131XSM9_IXORI
MDPGSADSSASSAGQGLAPSHSPAKKVKREDTSDAFDVQGSLSSSGTEVRVKQEVVGDDEVEEEDPMDAALSGMEFFPEQEDAGEPQSLTSSFAGVRVKQEPVSDEDTYDSSVPEGRPEEPEKLSHSSSFHSVMPGGVEVHVKQECVSDEGAYGSTPECPCESSTESPLSGSFHSVTPGGMEVRVKRERVSDEVSGVECPRPTPIEESSLRDSRVAGFGGPEVLVKLERVGDGEAGSPSAMQASQEAGAESFIVPDRIQDAPSVQMIEIKQESGGQLFVVQSPREVATSSVGVNVSANQGTAIHTFVMSDVASLGEVMRVVPSGTDGTSNRNTQFVVDRGASTNLTFGNSLAGTSHAGTSVASGSGQRVYVASYEATNGTKMMRVVKPNSAVVPQPAYIRRSTPAARQPTHAWKKVPAEGPSSSNRASVASGTKVEKVDKGVQADIRPSSRTVSVQTSVCVRSTSVQTDVLPSDVVVKASTTSHCTLSLVRDQLPGRPSSSKELALSRAAPGEPKAPKKYVVSGSSLLQLLDKCQNCLRPVVPEVKVNGTLVEMSAVCSEGHLTTWRNQPSKA